jgi:hypothetical protein
MVVLTSYASFSLATKNTSYLSLVLTVP